MAGTPRPLSDLLPHHRRPLVLAAAAHGLAGALLILQAWLIAGILNDVVFGNDTAPGRRLLAVLPVLLARMGLLWLANVLAADIAIAVKGEVRRMLRAAPGRTTMDAGRFAGVLVEGVEALDPFVARYLPAMAQAVLLPAAILAVVLPLDWVSALVFALTAPLIPFFMILIGRGAERLNLEQWAVLARMSAYLLDTVQALPTLRLFGAVGREARQVKHTSELYRQHTMRVLRVAFLSALVLEFLATVSIALAAVFVGFALLWGAIPYQRGLFILLLAPEFYLPLRSLGAHYHARMEALGAAEQMAPMLVDESFPDSPPIPPAIVDSKYAPRLVVDSIRFGYSAECPILDGLSFVLEPCSLTALVGESGSGKSTIMALLRGRLTPWSGAMCVDGQSIGGRIPQPAWIPQWPHLFTGTIADNIRLGAPEASDDAVREAARRAHASGFIERLSEGYATRLGERGAGLSGGEVRRIALARAFLMQAPLILLDEPSASLDHDSEDALVAALDELRRDRTILVVAHRLTTVRGADQILMLADGRIVQKGRFAALAGTGGPFARLAGAASPLLAADAQGV